MCPKNCKNDSAKICLAEAVAEYGAVVWNDCEVLSLEAGQSRVHRARCVRDGIPVEVEADIFVLAAGGLETPAILLRSASAQWPEGLANGSGLVGKYLMRHYVDIYASFAKASALGGGMKQVAFNDFYLSDEDKLGTVQSFGFLPPSDAIVDSLQDDLRHGPVPAGGRCSGARAASHVRLPLAGFRAGNHDGDHHGFGQHHPEILGITLARADVAWELGDRAYAGGLYEAIAVQVARQRGADDPASLRAATRRSRD